MNVLLYGHTHIPRRVYPGAGERAGVRLLEKSLWILNSGSLGNHREGMPSFGVMTIRDGQILLSHGKTGY